jgi:hypothetical protein
MKLLASSLVIGTARKIEGAGEMQGKETLLKRRG